MSSPEPVVGDVEITFSVVTLVVVVATAAGGAEEANGLASSDFKLSKVFVVFRDPPPSQALRTPILAPSSSSSSASALLGSIVGDVAPIRMLVSVEWPPPPPPPLCMSPSSLSFVVAMMVVVMAAS